MIGGQTKTPTMSVLYEDRTDYVGGAGVVAEHLRAAGANVVFSTVLGEDALKDFTLKQLAERGIEVRPIIDATRPTRSEEHTSELQSLMRISYAVFCLKKKKKNTNKRNNAKLQNKSKNTAHKTN